MKVPLLLALPLLVLAGGLAYAEHASIDLRVYRYDLASGSIKDQAHASMDSDPPVGGLNPRPLLRVKAKEPLVLQFFYTNTYPHAEVKDVTIRYFVVREEKARQKNVPPLDKNVVMQGHFNLNFKPKSKVGARVSFTVPTPGIYLLRVQSENTESDHEHFSAIDIQAE
jgi:hypothetical protein